ncbi:MAG: anthranilate phosphoribosyltransferase [Burkholderiales bacterium]
MTPQSALNALIEKRDLTREEMRSVMEQIMTGEITPVQIGGIITALRCKGETVTELAAAAEVMRSLAARVEVADKTHLVDTCGTGGDASHTFNVSTASALVAASAGCRVAKHGNRSVSSTCGSADILEALGVYIALNPEQVARSVEEVGVGFMFAPAHHSAMKYAAPVRRELGVRTLFNLLGPLTNPAGAPNQIMGVFLKDLPGKLARVLQTLGSRHVMVVHGEDGLDEISIGGPTHIAELRQGEVKEYSVSPGDFGFRSVPLDAIRVDGKESARAMLLGVLRNEPSPARDIVAMNAGAAIYVSGVADSLQEGIRQATEAIGQGAARRKLDELVSFTVQFKPGSL